MSLNGEESRSVYGSESAIKHGQMFGQNLSNPLYGPGFFDLCNDVLNDHGGISQSVQGAGHGSVHDLKPSPARRDSYI